MALKNYYNINGSGNPIQKAGHQFNRYPWDKFTNCEMCGESILPLTTSALFFDVVNYVYKCTKCNFEKSYSHVSFGFYRKIPNYISLTKTHDPKKLYMSDHISIQEKLLESPEKASFIWNKWINSNILEIVKLAVLSDTHILGSTNVNGDNFNPILHLKEAINNVKQSYLHFNLKPNKKIGAAIDFCLKNSSTVIWLGENVREKGVGFLRVLESASVRLHKLFLKYTDYKDYKDYIESPQVYNIRGPVFITGSSAFFSKMSQRELDEYIDKFLTDFNNDQKEHSKLKIILNTGNTGVDTSVVRWANKNKVHSIVANLPAIMYLNKYGFNRYDTEMCAKTRLLDPSYEADRMPIPIHL